MIRFVAIGVMDGVSQVSLILVRGFFARVIVNQRGEDKHRAQIQPQAPPISFLLMVPVSLVRV